MRGPYVFLFIRFTADSAANYLLKYLWECISSIIEEIFIAIFKASWHRIILLWIIMFGFDFWNFFVFSLYFLSSYP